jgi:hypothetical protein
MVKFTLAEAQAYFEQRHMRLTYQDWNQRYRVEFPNSTFSANLFKTLDGAVKSYSHGKGAEFERWLIGYRAKQVRP